jgi:3-deoxy-manno-octulosonate cytidylyltransferase (CMP-KDO synthetase)
MDFQDIVVAIPARLESTRLPRKPLLDCAGHPLLWHTWQAGVRWAGFERVWIVTDSEEIRQVMAGYGANVVFDPREYRNGTRRIGGALDRLPGSGYLVNLQCDEPQLEPDDFEELVAVVGFHHAPVAHIGTLAAPRPRGADRPDDVKVVVNRRGRAMHFTRERLPGAWHHVGAYIFRRNRFAAIQELPPGRLAELERLEQLDWLEAGLTVRVVHLDCRPLAVNTTTDLEAFRNQVERNGAVDETRSEPRVAGS